MLFLEWRMMAETFVSLSILIDFSLLRKLLNSCHDTSEFWDVSTSLPSSYICCRLFHVRTLFLDLMLMHCKISTLITNPRNYFVRQVSPSALSCQRCVYAVENNQHPVTVLFKIYDSKSLMFYIHGATKLVLVYNLYILI